MTMATSRTRRVSQVHSERQEAQLSLTNRPTPVRADVPCCAVKCCPLVNDCDLLAAIFDFYPSLSHLTPSMRGNPRAIGFILYLVWKN